MPFSVFLTSDRAIDKLRRARASVVAAACLIGPTLGALPAQAASQSLSLVSTTTQGVATTSAAPGSKLILSTRMPVSNEIDTVTQEIIQEIDPAKIRLTGASDVVGPEGWTTDYSTDGTNFTATPADWASVVKVRSRGSINSQGATNDGRQIDVGSTTIVTPPVLRVPAAASGGDGYDVTFDDRGYIFNMYHHDAPVALDCHVRATAATCPGTWPFFLGNGLHTNNNSTSFVDNVNHHVWFPNNTSSNVGFGCVDVSNISQPSFCGGSFATGYKPMANNGSNGHSAAGQIVGVGDYIFSWNTRTGQLMCFNIMANQGLGTNCATTAPTFSLVPSNPDQDFYYDLMAQDSLVYGFHSRNGIVTCFDSKTMGKCPNWSTFEISIGGGVNSSGKDGWGQGGIYLLPDANGDIIGTCFVPQRKCVKPDASVVAAMNSGLSAVMDIQIYSQPAVTTGTKVLWMNSYFNKARCYDVATNAWCANWNDGIWHGGNGYGGYTVSADPENSNCVWTNSDDGRIRSYDVLTAALGCTSPPSRVAFKNNLVPIRTCDGTESVQQWRSFKLTGIPAADYSSATLTIKTAGGSVLTSGGTTWYKIPIPKVGGRLVDISAIDPAESGLEPQFIIDFVGRTTTVDVSAEVSVAGGAPQLCVAVTMQPNCPEILAPTYSLASWNATFQSTGSAMNSSNQVTTLSPANISLTSLAPSAEECGAPITGTVLDKSITPAPITGLTVSLLDGSGNPLNYPSDYPTVELRGKPIVTQTTKGGIYSFPTLFRGVYRVGFPDAEGWAALNSTVVSGAGGTSTGVANASLGQAVSKVTAVAAGVGAVVNAQYIVLASAKDDQTFTGAGRPVSLQPLQNDTPGSAESMASGSVFLCSLRDKTDLYDADSCTLRPEPATPMVTADGSYVLDSTTGVVTFTPAARFQGLITQPVHYIARDTFGTVVTAALRIVVVGSDDDSSGLQGDEQILDILANDVVDGQSPFDLTSVRLCDPALSEQAPTCTALSVTIKGEGTYTVRSDGSVSFVPESDYVGTGTSLGYQVTNGDGNVASASLSVTVLPVAPPVAKPDTKAASKDRTAVIDLISNDESTGTTLVVGTLRLCGQGEAPPSCTQTRVVTDQGTFILDTKSGKVRFIAAMGFRGTATLRYVVADTRGQVTDSTIQVTVPEEPIVVLPKTGSDPLPIACAGLVLVLVALAVRFGKFRMQ
ncbi:MAG: hypothetical protein RL745_99 [Actinomycetota bacterium]